MKLDVLRPAAAVVIGLALLGCRPGSEPPAEAAPPLNVVVVLVDTLRADHMRLYGYERPTTPFIDRFAADSVVFDWAWSQASCTFPSVNSIMTSRYPGVFIRQGPGEMGIPNGMPTLQGVLRERGYQTIAVSASPIVRATPTEYNPSGGFDRDFDTFVEGCLWLHGGCLTAKILDQLDLVEEPFMLWAHYMEPHDPYKPPDNYTRRFALEYDGPDFIRNGDPNPIGEMIYDDGPDLDLEDRDIQHLVDLYDDEIRSFDNVFRRLVNQLDERGLLERTIVVLASDHGEEFLEHGHVKHCRGSWATLSHVPMILRVPGVTGAGRVAEAVENIDLTPTVLDYLGIDTASLGFEGASLRPLIEGRAQPPHLAFSNQGRYRAVADGSFHLIVDGAERTAEIYRSDLDPLEQNDLHAPGHPAMKTLAPALNRWLAATGQLLRLDEELAAARAKEEELRALGYIQ